MNYDIRALEELFSSKVADGVMQGGHHTFVTQDDNDE